MIEGSFMKALFFGVIAEDIVFPYPLMSDAEREQGHALSGMINDLRGSVIDSEAIDEQAHIPESAVLALRELGLFGLHTPAEYGGMGLGVRAYTRAIQSVSELDMAVALRLLAHEATGTAALSMFGNDEQKKRFVPRLASGELEAAFALAENASGSDAGAMQTRVTKQPDGDWVLNGEKRWVLGGDTADLFVVFARTQRASEGRKPNMNALIVERGPGVEHSSVHPTLGVRGAHTVDLKFRDVRVPALNVLGPPGKGFRVAQEVINFARIPLAGILVGQARTIANETIRYVGARRSFGRLIQDFPIIKDKLTRMLADCFAIESMTHLTAGLADRQVEDFSLESAICRVAGAEALWRVANDAMQIAGGSGYVRPHALERRLRDARVGSVLYGTNETLRCFIALAGMHGPGKKLSEVVTAMREPVKGFGLLREFAVRKVKEALRRERISRAHPLLNREVVMFEEATDALTRAVEVKLRDHGTEIAEMQYVQMRIANVAMDLFALAACISRTTRAIEQRGEEGARRQLDLTTMFATSAQGRINGYLARLDRNDDELRKLIASRACEDGSYPFDVV